MARVFGEEGQAFEIEVGEKVGWRFWRSDLGSFELRSAIYWYDWVPGVNQSMLTPREGAVYGFYGFKNIDRLTRYFDTFARFKHAKSRDIFCIGFIDMWGDMIEGEYGYRSQFASIINIVCAFRHIQYDRIDRKAIIDYIPDCELIDRIRKKYGLKSGE